MTIILWDERGPAEQVRTADAALACAVLHDYAQRAADDETERYGVTVTGECTHAVRALLVRLFGSGTAV